MTYTCLISLVNCPSHCWPLPTVLNGDVVVQLKKKVVIRCVQPRKKVVLRNVCVATVECYDRKQVSDPPKLYCGDGAMGWIDDNCNNNTGQLQCL